MKKADSVYKKIIIYLSVFLLLVASGNPVIRLLPSTEIVYLGLFLISVSIFYFMKPRVILDPWVLAFFSAVVIVFTFQVLLYGDSVINTNIGFLLKLSTAFLIASASNNLVKIYVAVMVFSATISLIIYSLSLIGFSSALQGIGVDVGASYTLFFQTIFYGDSAKFRNSGMFWEPGAFAGYLAVALILLLLEERFKVRRSSVVFMVLVLVASILTTKSTTGYLVLMGIIAYWFYQSVNKFDYVLKLLFRISGIIISLVFFYQLYNSLDFLHEKIENRMEDNKQKHEQHQINRIGNFLYDIDYIVRQPIVGWSGVAATKNSVDPFASEFADAQGNGLSGFVVKYGVVVGGLYLVLVYRSMMRKYKSPVSSGFVVVVFMLVLFGEQYLNYPTLFIFAFLPAAKKIRIKKRRRRVAINNGSRKHVV